jgi:hypothetical protein
LAYAWHMLRMLESELCNCKYSISGYSKLTNYCLTKYDKLIFEWRRLSQE